MIRLYVVLILMVVTVNGQTLFDDAGTSKPIRPVVIQDVAVLESSDPIPVRLPPVRYISTNLESVIARGDIQLGYEIPQSSAWSTMLSIHANPQSQLNDTTGEYGVLGGGRFYLDGRKDAWFLQGLMGFNHQSNWHLVIAIEAGRRMTWKSAIFVDTALAIHRSYASNHDDPFVYLKVNVSFGLDQPLVPFL